MALALSIPVVCELYIPHSRSRHGADFLLSTGVVTKIDMTPPSKWHVFFATLFVIFANKPTNFRQISWSRRSSN